jgi:hypothetical protein
VTDENPIAHRYRLLKPHLTDHELRAWAAAEASVLGPGASATVARITGIPEADIRRTQKQLTASAKTEPERSST